MHPDLLELARRLEANGTVVVRFKDRLELRLPLFASVHVRIVDGRLDCEPRFGIVGRERATFATLIGIAAVTAAAFLDYGVTPISMMLGFLSVSSGASTAIRYQLTEACITRVQMAYMLMTANRPAALPSTEQRPRLGEPEPRVPQSARTRQDERV
jgi:hypothetical protein